MSDPHEDVARRGHTHPDCGTAHSLGLVATCSPGVRASRAGADAPNNPIRHKDLALTRGASEEAIRGVASSVFGGPLRAS